MQISADQAVFGFRCTDQVHSESGIMSVPQHPVCLCTTVRLIGEVSWGATLQAVLENRSGNSPPSLCC